uniref:Retrovirus-related Pol polyprotein from transposon TNT 1-94-like beta-barrel domain-containing protein n=1 Tax=Cajanus cajan TaxID=3821 RepID=A0A151SVA1_CAJCA|nr:hypothetical protein KK1_014139 [Cajanus cajan]
MMVTWNDSEGSSSNEGEEQAANLCLMADLEQECLLHKNKKWQWYLDSGYSTHMTRDKSKFLTLEKKVDGGFVSFGDNKKATIKGIGKIANMHLAKINNVCYVKRLKHNLLSINQICINGYEVMFEPNSC